MYREQRAEVISIWAAQNIASKCGSGRVPCLGQEPFLQGLWGSALNPHNVVAVTACLSSWRLMLLAWWSCCNSDLRAHLNPTSSVVRAVTGTGGNCWRLAAQ